MLLDDIHKMMVRFWRGQKDNERKMAWNGWKTLCRQKTEDGMNFKDRKAFNVAMLGKQ